MLCDHVQITIFFLHFVIQHLKIEFILGVFFFGGGSCPYFKFKNIFSFNKAVLLDSMVRIVMLHAAVTAHIVTTLLENALEVVIRGSTELFVKNMSEVSYIVYSILFSLDNKISSKLLLLLNCFNFQKRQKKQTKQISRMTCRIIYLFFKVEFSCDRRKWRLFCLHYFLVASL